MSRMPSFIYDLSYKGRRVSALFSPIITALICWLAAFLCGACTTSHEEEEAWETIKVVAFVYEDYVSKDEIGMRRDSVYIIDNETSLQRATQRLSTLRQSLRGVNFGQHTVLLLASWQDYNIAKQTVLVRRNIARNDYYLSFDYALSDPKKLPQLYCRVNAVVVPKIDRPVAHFFHGWGIH